MQEAQKTALPEFLPNLDVRVIVFSLRDNRLQALLIPHPDSIWELPGSEVPCYHSLEETATENVLRLTGLREAFLEQLYTYGEVSRCPTRRLISVIYFAIVPAGISQTAPTSPIDKDEFTPKWFPVDQLPALCMDFQEVVDYAQRRLRYKLEYTAVGFQLLPEYFTLSELQQTYEMILGETLDKRNFRRRILQAGIIEETLTRRGGEGRPARLYRYRPDAVAEIKTRRLFP